MKLSLNWVSEFVDLAGITPEELSLKLTLSTCEVDGLETVYDNLDSILVAKVTEVKKHPDADKLQVCSVDTGKEYLQVVTGATNIKENILVALAPVGSRVLDREANPIEIKRTKLRGMDSSGMFCSPGELSLERLFPDIDGILVLEDLDLPGSGHIPELEGKWKPGMPLAKVMPFGKDMILDIDNKSITHRPDLWCHYGFAREIAAIYRRKLKKDPLSGSPPLRGDDKLPAKQIEIEEGAAHAYYGAYLDGVRVQDSPLWMQARLASIGQKPINNIVDASNYMLFESAQPNHAFDASVLKGDTITVGFAGTKHKVKEFTTLDGERHKIPSDTVMVFDSGKAHSSTSAASSTNSSGGGSSVPVALAGVMGGLDFSVNQGATALFLESATFPREAIRKTISALQLRTDSSVRFEKGQDPAKAKPGIQRLVELIRLTCPEAKAGKITGSSPQKETHSKIDVTLSFLRSRLGFPIKEKQIVEILESLQFEIKQSEPSKKGEVLFRIKAPTFRSQYDVTIPEDIVEELGRIHGYDNIEPVAPTVPVNPPEVSRQRMLERRVKEILIDRGQFRETLNYSFVPQSHNLIYGMSGLRLLNPIADRQFMRISLIPGLLRQAAANQDRFTDVRLFESGRVYIKDGKKNELAREERRIALFSMPESAIGKVRHLDDSPAYHSFLAMRRVLEGIFNELTTGYRIVVPEKEQFTVRSSTETENQGNSPEKPVSLVRKLPHLHPGCAVEYLDSRSNRLATLGIVHPHMEQEFDLRRGSVIGELDLDTLLVASEEKRIENAYSAPSSLPYSDFELSLLMKEDRSTGEPVEIIRSLNHEDIRSIRLLTVYRGEPLPEDTRSVSYQVSIGRDDRTISGEEVQAAMNQSIEALEKAGYRLR